MTITTVVVLVVFCVGAIEANIRILSNHDMVSTTYPLLLTYIKILTVTDAITCTWYQFAFRSANIPRKEVC